MTSQSKRTIDLTIPSITVVVVGFLLLRKGKDWTYVGITAVVLFILLYIIVSQSTKAIRNIAEQPDHVNVKPDASGNIDSSFDPDPWVDKLRNDLYCYFCFRDTQLYADLARLSNASIVKIYNRWNEKYKSDKGETVVAAIDADYFTGAAYTNAKVFNDRLKGMGLT